MDDREAAKAIDDLKALRAQVEELAEVQTKLREQLRDAVEQGEYLIQRIKEEECAVMDDSGWPKNS
jgi:FtsZ-binding cell division protein ZapB